MSNALGIDVSKWQGEMNWQKAAEAGARFAIIRAGSISVTGTLYEDYQFIRNSGLAPEHIPYISYYWYFRPQFGPNKQADYFCELVDGSFKNLRLVLDSENNGGLTAKLTAEANQLFCERIFNNTGIWPKLYTRATFFNPFVEERPLWSTLDLWIARYTSKPKPWGNPGDYASVTPRDWDDWVFWQWSADANGRGTEFGAKSASIDLNYFNGDELDLEAYSKAIYAPAVPSDRIYVSREGGALLYRANNLSEYVGVLPYRHKMVTDGTFTASDGKLYYIVGDCLVSETDATPL